jgi:hypothetical protein
MHRIEEAPRLDIFALQDSVTQLVVGAIEPELDRAEIARVSRNPIGNIDPYGLDALTHLSNFSAGAGDFLSGGFMNLGNVTQRILGHRAIPISELLRQELVASIGLNDPVDYCGTAYSLGKYSGLALGASVAWSAGLSAGSSTVIYSPLSAVTRAQGLGSVLGATPIGGLLFLAGWIAIGRLAAATERGMERTEDGLRKAIDLIRSLREDFHRNVKTLGSAESLNQSLEKAGRVADFFELAELMCLDALERNESCGGHFREEYQTEDGEALRNDDKFCHVAAWEYAGDGKKPVRNVEPLAFDNVHLQQRSYK